MKKSLRIFLILIACLVAYTLTSNPAGAQELASEEIIFEADNWDEETSSDIVSDPVRPINKLFFRFNHTLIRYLFSPLSKGYDVIIPQVVQKKVDNIFFNIAMPKRLFNNLLQAKPKQSGVVLSRFMINTTVGIGGIFDPAKHWFELEKQKEDFGQTLGSYGMSEGFYLVLPFLGPSSARDVVGYVVDTAFNPFFWMGVYDIEPEDAFEVARVVRRVNNFSLNVRDNYESVVEDAFDPYTALQHAYVENRRKKIAK